MAPATPPKDAPIAKAKSFILRVLIPIAFALATAANYGDSALNSACRGSGSSAGFGPRFLGLSVRLVTPSKFSTKASLPPWLPAAPETVVSS